MHIYKELNYINESSLALGFFDAIHLGHRVVLNNAINVAKKNNTQSTVITFLEHPLKYLSLNKTQMILSQDEKLDYMEKLGIDNVVLLDFKEISKLSARDYIENVLIKYFSPIAITTGFNHTFGFNKTGNSSLLRELAKEFNYKYFEIPPFVVDGEIVSCSNIRNKILNSDFISATKLLGYRYYIEATVVKGQKIASKLGFPSANVIYPEDKIDIPHGVYYVLVEVMGKTYNGILNHGYAPTIDNNEVLKTEVHIVNFNKNIYGEKIKISFVTKIRNQMKFENVDKLIAQLSRDVAFTDIFQHFLDGGIKLSCKKFLM